LGNTVGSLSEVQHAIVVGTLLGDGAMRCETNALLEVNHSAAQWSYVDGNIDIWLNSSLHHRSSARATDRGSRVDS
jgi:hypothetical protein